MDLAQSQQPIHRRSSLPGKEFRGNSRTDDSGMVLSCACAVSRGDVTFDALPEEDWDDLRRTALGLLRLLAEFATNAVRFFGGF